MLRFTGSPTPKSNSRRSFLWDAGGGFAGLALADLLLRDGLFSKAAAAATESPQAKAKHCVFLFMNGGPSQVDTFDPKPALEKYHGQPYKGATKVGSNGRPVGYLMKSPFEFKQHGESGLPVSSL